MAFVAAEAREFSGLLRHAERVERLHWPLDFARKIWVNGRALLLVANGPGPKLAAQAAGIAREHEELDGLVSTGFCGALDPALRAGDIFIATEVLPLGWPVSDLPTRDLPSRDRQGAMRSGKLLSADRVASTAAEKAELRKTGAAAIEMEAAAVAEKAREYNLPFYCIRVVTDTAAERLPLDFNALRDADGRFSRARIVAAALRRPLVFPKLIRFSKKCNAAAKALGDFIADTRF